MVTHCCSILNDAVLFFIHRCIMICLSAGTDVFLFTFFRPRSSVPALDASVMRCFSNFRFHCVARTSASVSSRASGGGFRKPWTSKKQGEVWSAYMQNSNKLWLSDSRFSSQHCYYIHLNTGCLSSSQHLADGFNQGLCCLDQHLLSLQQQNQQKYTPLSY